jgi:hypothetical protein
MALGKTNAGGGTGGSGFAIVCGTERPNNAADNMVWVDTNYETTNYVFSAVEPATPTDGMLWVKIANAGSVNVTAPVGKEWIKLCLGLVHQYVNGQWVRRAAKLYKDGEWMIVSSIFAAYITVTYPAKSTCTVTDGATTLTDTNDTDTEKTTIFIVPNEGTWTVTSAANDGIDDSAEKTVEITAEGQSESVILAYWNGELYVAGNEYTAITGGWTLNGYTHSTITLQPGVSTGGKMAFGGASGIYQVLGTERAISLTGINKIRIVGEVTSVFGSGDNANGLALSVLTTKSFSNIVKELPINKVGKFDHTLDVSGLDGDYYIVIRAEAAPGCAGNVTEVRLNEI